MSEATITSMSLGRGEAPSAPAAQDYLVVVAQCDQPAEPSSRHVIDHLDEVRFGRGDRSVVRRGRVLELRFPDPRMSSDHGRLLRSGNGWVLDDPDSKNGTVVDGRPTRNTAIERGTVFELGRTFVRFDRGRLADVDRLDVRADELAPPHAMLATFHGELAERFANLARIADGDVSVILLGPTGTGKEVVARALHDLSGRRGAFVAVNCGGLPETLVENELFGHKKGAFSGAAGERTGLVRSADAGTLFLDEIGELPPASQAALLRVLQEREVTPIGADRPIEVDLRVCCATLRDLDDMIDDGGFRRDLYARLSGYTLELPPLAARRADLGLLLGTLLAKIPSKHPVRIAPPAMRAFLAYDWPLNIRELQKVLAAGVALSPDGMIDLPQLPEALASPPKPVSVSAQQRRPAVPDAPASEADRALREQLVGLLTAHAGNVVAVAEQLGKRRMQIYRWVKKFDIDLDAFRKP